jgi:hypothetical protein
MQGKNENVLSSMDRIGGFLGKLKLWLELIASGSAEMFQTICSFGADKTLLSVIEEHLNFQKKFKVYFGSSVKDLDWVCDVFGAV